jgi:hypothetical protein
MSNTIVNPGVYETLISQAIEDKLKELPDSKYYIQKEGIDSAESYKMLAEYLTEIVSGILKSYFRLKDSKETISAQVDVVTRIFHSKPLVRAERLILLEPIYAVSKLLLRLKI